MSLLILELLIFQMSFFRINLSTYFFKIEFFIKKKIEPRIENVGWTIVPIFTKDGYVLSGIY